MSELPNTPEYLETLIPPAYNPDAFIRDHYFEYMFANAGHENGQDRVRVVTQGSPAEGADDAESDLGDMLPGPIIDVDPVKRRSPVLPAIKHNNPFDEEDSPVLQPVDSNDKNSIDNLSFGRASDGGKSEPISLNIADSFTRRTSIFCRSQ